MWYVGAARKWARPPPEFRHFDVVSLAVPAGSPEGSGRARRGRFASFYAAPTIMHPEDRMGKAATMAAAMVVFSACGPPSADDLIARAEERILFDARLYCDRQVSARLVSPATARTSNDRAQYRWTDSGVDSSQIVVSVVVDAQNRMGGVMRGHYQCVLAREVDGFRAVQVTIRER